MTGNVREWMGNINAFNDWAASSSRSSLILERNSDFDCTSSEQFDFGFLQGQDFDFSDATAIQRFVDGLENIELQDLNQPLTGFRCCR